MSRHLVDDQLGQGHHPSEKDPTSATTLSSTVTARAPTLEEPAPKADRHHEEALIGGTVPAQ